MADRVHHYGSGEAHCDVARYDVLEYFGGIGDSDPAGILTFPPVDVTRTKEWTAGDAVIRLWRIVSTVREVQQRDQEQQPPIPAASIEAALQQLGVNRTCLKLRISVTEMGFDPRDYLIDAGNAFELWGRKVTVRWVAPATVDVIGAIEVAGPNTIQGRLGVQILGIETPLGFAAPLTDYRGVAANTRLQVPIPRGAIDVTVYQTAAGTASTAWLWRYGGAPIVPWELGELPFIAGQRRTHTTSIVPGATHLASDIDAAADRFFTIVWTIRP